MPLGETRDRTRVVLCGAMALILLATSAARAFELMSPDVKPNGVMPEKFTFNGFDCHGQNVSPALSWSNPPEGT